MAHITRAATRRAGRGAEVVDRFQIRRRFYGADRIREDKLVLSNPATMRVERYRYRGAQIATPFNIDMVDPAGARFRRTDQDDAEFVGQVSELITGPIGTLGEPGA